MKHLLILLLSIFIFLGCSKDSGSTMVSPPPKPFEMMTEAQKLAAYRSDPDIKNILTIQLETADKLVRSGIDFTHFDFNNEDQLLKILQISKAEYLAEIASVQKSARAFIARYRISTTRTCETCQMNQQEKFSGLGDLIARFKNDDDYYAGFRADILSKTDQVTTGHSVNLVATQSAVSEGYCGFWFYACITLCAASTEVLPVYLLCCAYCYHAECTTNS